MLLNYHQYTDIFTYRFRLSRKIILQINNEVQLFQKLLSMQCRGLSSMQQLSKLHDSAGLLYDAECIII